MNIIYISDPEDLAKQAYNWCESKNTEYKAKSIYLPAGNTPIGLYRLLEGRRPTWMNDKKLIQVDEISTGKKAGLFNRFFAEHLPHYHEDIIAPELTGAVEGEQAHQAELCILGLGLNGHIAFHEPDLPRDFAFGEVELAAKTKSSLQLEHDARGISYGAGMFLKSKAILLMVVGESKKEIFAELLSGSTTPAGYLMEHPDLTILCEESCWAAGS